MLKWLQYPAYAPATAMRPPCSGGGTGIFFQVAFQVARPSGRRAGSAVGSLTLRQHSMSSFTISEGSVSSLTAVSNQSASGASGRRQGCEAHAIGAAISS